jgi:hypothetical protein
MLGKRVEPVSKVRMGSWGENWDRGHSEAWRGKRELSVMPDFGVGVAYFERLKAEGLKYGQKTKAGEKPDLLR